MIPVETLRTWFLSQQRSFPWREDRSPYAVWVSEVMLQQTRAAVVIPYFLRWMNRFPTIAALAEAPIEEVIKLWEGLGYYSRARNLHRGAQEICQQYHGVFPHSEDDLKTIPGLGPYTIGAIRSFAFQKKAAAVDGNVLRVLSRFFALTDDIAKGATRKKMEERILSFLPEKAPWEISEALIELGATVCSPKPNCFQCPLQSSCRAFKEGRADELPIKSKKQKTEKLFRAVPVIQWEDCLLIEQVKKGRVMSDLHEFPYLETSEEGFDPQELKSHLEDKWSLALSYPLPLQEVTHTFTRYVARLRPVLFSAKEKVEIPPNQWVSRETIASLPFSSGHRRILHAVLSQERDWLPIA